MIDVKALSNFELLKIVEQPSDWQQKVVMKATVEISQRAIDTQEINESVRKFFYDRCNKIIDQSGFNPKSLMLPPSEYLSEEERTKIFDEAFSNFLSDRDLFYGDLNPYITYE